MKIFFKILAIIFSVAVIAGISYFIDAKVFDKGENFVYPDVSISEVFLDPLVVADGGYSILSAKIQGDASSVKAEVAKRVAPTKAGDVFQEYEMEKIAELGNDLFTYACIIEAPKEKSEYLVTAVAKDKNNKETKNKLFSLILRVKAPQEEIKNKTKAQLTISLFYESLNKKDYKTAYSLLTEDYKQKFSYDEFINEYASFLLIKAKEFEVLSGEENDDRVETDKVKRLLIYDNERKEEDEVIFTLERESREDTFYKINEIKSFN